MVGCVLALLVATVAPSAPLRRPRILAAQVLQEMAGTLDAADQRAAGSRQRTPRTPCWSGPGGVNRSCETLQDAADEGLAVVRLSPFRRRDRRGVEAYAELTGPIGRAQRNLRVLARRCVAVLWRGETVPSGYLLLMAQLAEVMQNMASELYDGRLPESARRRLVDIAARQFAPADRTSRSRRW